MSKQRINQELIDLPILNQQRTLGSGSASMVVSALGFGAMGLNYHRGASPDKKMMITLLQQAVEHGVTFFDTAQVYGPFTNEALVGEGLSPYKNKVKIATKFGHKIIDGQHINELDSRPETIRLAVEGSLKRLNIEVIDLFYQHRFDPNVPIEEVAGTIKDLITEGKVKHFGLCEVNADIIGKAHTVQPITAIQSEYNLMWRTPEKEIFPTLQELGIGFVPYSPINRGFLGGTLNEHTQFLASNDNRASLPRFTPSALRANKPIVDILNEFGQTRGMSSSQVALCWLLNKQPWIVPIPGTTKLSHLEENLRSVKFTLSQDEIKQLESLLEPVSIMGDRYPAAEQQQIK